MNNASQPVSPIETPTQPVQQPVTPPAPAHAPTLMLVLIGLIML